MLDAPDVLDPIDGGAMLDDTQGDNTVEVDEEGRPRFAPARDIVRTPIDYGN